MAEKRLKIWFDKEGDYLEVIFDQKAGYFRETASDQVMEKVDEQGNIVCLASVESRDAMRQMAATMAATTICSDVLLPPDSDTIEIGVTDSEGNMTRYEALPPGTRMRARLLDVRHVSPQEA